MNPSRPDAEAAAPAVCASQQRLAALRTRAGAAPGDAAALAWAAAVLRRAADAEAAGDLALRDWLLPRVDARLAEVDRSAAGGPAAEAPATVAPASAFAPLRAALAASGGGGELAALREARPTLARLRVERQLARAEARRPDNPGPLNSEHLILRALQQMQAAAPACLGAFVAQVEALIWLDEARGAGGKGPAAAAPVSRRPAARR